MSLVSFAYCIPLLHNTQFAVDMDMHGWITRFWLYHGYCGYPFQSCYHNNVIYYDIVMITQLV